MSEALLLSIKEAGELLGIGRTKTYELVSGGAIPSVRIGARVLVPRAELVRWVEAQTAAARGEQPGALIPVPAGNDVRSFGNGYQAGRGRAR